MIIEYHKYMCSNLVFSEPSARRASVAFGKANTTERRSPMVPPPSHPAPTRPPAPQPQQQQQKQTIKAPRSQLRPPPPPSEPAPPDQPIIRQNNKFNPSNASKFINIFKIDVINFVELYE